MSIVAAAVQAITAKAIRGATMAGDNVVEVPLDPLMPDFQRLTEPMVAVFTGAVDGEAQGGDLLGAEQTIELTFQIYLPEGVTVTSNGMPLEIDVRAGGADFVCNVLTRQVLRAVLASDSKWAQLWRVLAPNRPSIQNRPYLFEISKGVRIAAREVTMTLETLCEPSFGGGLFGFWRDAFDAFSSDPDLGPLAAWLEAETTAPADLAGWRIAQADIGISRDTLAAIGIAPAYADAAPTEAPVDVTEVVAIGDGNESVTVTEDTETPDGAP